MRTLVYGRFSQPYRSKFAPNRSELQRRKNEDSLLGICATSDCRRASPARWFGFRLRWRSFPRIAVPQPTIAIVNFSSLLFSATPDAHHAALSLQLASTAEGRKTTLASACFSNKNPTAAPSYFVHATRLHQQNRKHQRHIHVVAISLSARHI